MQKIRHKETAFLMYFIFLLLLVFINMDIDMDLVNIIYLFVVLCCSLKFILIVSENKK